MYDPESMTMEDTAPVVPMNCDICGTDEFYCDAGFYFCSLCNTQSQQTRQYVEEEAFAPERQFTVRRAGVLREGIDHVSVTLKGEKKRLSSWEVYNLVIKAMTDKLIHLGFPELLKPKAFQLWTAYLLKRQTIFVSTEKKKKKSRVTLGEPKLNLYALHDHKPPKRNQTNRRKRKAAALENEEMISTTQVKKRKSLSRKKAMEKQYLQDVSQLAEGGEEGNNAGGVGGEVNEEEALDLEPPPEKLKLTDAGQKVRSALKDYRTGIDIRYDGRTRPPGLATAEAILKIERFTLKNIIVLIFVALRQVGCSVVFSDLMRILHDGTLFVDSITPLLGEDEVEYINTDCNRFLASVYKFDNIPRCAGLIDQFVEYVGVKNFRYPEFAEFLPKFIDEFVLPLEFECLVIQINNMFSMKHNLQDLRKEMKKWKPLVEIWVLTVMGVVLKMIFGLDDTTEKFQSHFARTVNAIVTLQMRKRRILRETERYKEYTKLFVPDDWFAYLRYRDGLVRHELYSSSMYHPVQTPNINRVNDLIIKYGGQQVERKGTIARASAKAKEMFQKIVSDAHPGEQCIPIVPDYMTLVLPKESVVQQYLASFPAVAYPDFSKEAMKQDFKTSRIDYVFNPKKYLPLLRRAGYRVKVIKGDARNYSKPLIFDSKTLVVFQPYKAYDDFIGKSGECSASMQYIFDSFVSIVAGADRMSTQQPLFRAMMELFGDLYSRRCLAGFIPLTLDTDSD